MSTLNKLIISFSLGTGLVLIGVYIPYLLEKWNNLFYSLSATGQSVLIIILFSSALSLLIFYFLNNLLPIFNEDDDEEEGDLE